MSGKVAGKRGGNNTKRSPVVGRKRKTEQETMAAILVDTELCDSVGGSALLCTSTVPL